MTMTVIQTEKAEVVKYLVRGNALLQGQKGDVNHPVQHGWPLGASYNFNEARLGLLL
jgi:hypothetical protein